MDLTVHASKIVKNYLSNNVDMNDGIAKVASEKNLNLEQTKRLVEECNKTCYLDKLASTGEQTFDIADMEKIKAKFEPVTEMKKVASAPFQYGDFNAYGSGKADDFVNAYNTVIEKCANTIGSSLVKLAALRKQACYATPAAEGIKESELPTVLETLGMNKLASEISTTLADLDRNEKIRDAVMEKRAGILTGVAGVAAKTGGAATSLVIKHPGKSINTYFGAETFKHGMEKVKEEPKGIGNVDLSKHASITSQAVQVFKDNAGLALALGAIGIGVAAAQKMGGTASQMMTNRQLDRAFDTMVQTNKDIKGMSNAREYFDVVARHSPSLALDPMVAPTLVRQFDTFGGVDINTVGKLRDIESSNGGSGRPNNSVGDFLGGITALQGMEKHRNGLELHRSIMKSEPLKFQKLLNEVRNPTNSTSKKP